MIKLPDFKRAFDYENNFYLSCDISRISKLIIHYELYKMSKIAEGDVIECGICKGVSFTRFAAFRQIVDGGFKKRLIGFDTFSKFPESSLAADKGQRQVHIDTAGEESISTWRLTDVLEHKGINKNIELVKGDILETVPRYIKSNPGLKISLLNLDTDIYDPSKTILEYLYPKISKGGILILDDYGVFPGETKAVDEYFKGKNIKIKNFSFRKTPCYIVKE